MPIPSAHRIHRHGGRTSAEGLVHAVAAFYFSIPKLKISKINGLEVLKILKVGEHLKTIPIVTLTSSRETPDLTECYTHSVNAHPVKQPSIFAQADETNSFAWEQPEK